MKIKFVDIFGSFFMLDFKSLAFFQKIYEAISISLFKNSPTAKELPQIKKPLMQIIRVSGK